MSREIRAAIGAVVGAAALFFATAGAAATVFDGVTLHGVQILGSTYDVTFHDGSLDDVFPTRDFTFTTDQGANAALDAILGQAAFQSLLPSAADFFGVIVPVSIDANYFYAQIDGGLFGRATLMGVPHASLRNFTYATFDASAVPEPATWAMMIVGFGAMGSMVRASRRRSAFAAV